MTLSSVIAKRCKSPDPVLVAATGSKCHRYNALLVRPMENTVMKPSFALKLCAVFAGAVLAAACSSLKDSTSRLGSLIEPYRVEVVQGNVVTKEQTALLRPGLTRNQVRDLLGTPLITSVFHAQRWDYAFTIRRQGTQPLQRHVSVFFENDVMTRYEADELPSEAEFTARIDSRLKGNIKQPKLEASAEELKPYLPAQTAQQAPPPAPPPVNMAYPPLEPQR
jgi:outer membrane protein assembly factor BamE